MNEGERAEWLARAIDDLLKRDRQSEAAAGRPAGLEAGELEALMRVARARLATANETAHAGVQYEGAIWQRVLSRLEAQPEHSDSGDAPNWLTNAGAFAAGTDADDSDPSWLEIDALELREIALLRRRMAEEAAALAEGHREAVWRRLQSRIQEHPQKAGVLSFLHSLLQQPPRKQEPSDDELLDDLIRLARGRREASAQTEPAFSRRTRLWARVVSGLSGQIPGLEAADGASRARSRASRRRLVNFASAVAIGVLVIAALGPIPATGLADHPAAELARFVGQRTGVTETAAPPAAAGDAAIVRGTDANAAQASTQLGFAVAEPAAIPEGFERTSSQVYPQALTAAEGGMFVLTYEGDDSSVVIYQEQASGSDIATATGSSFAVTLADGTPATYIDGAWQAGSGGFAWSDAASQTLLFERGGTRAIVRYAGPRVERAFLFVIANGMAER